MSERELTQLRHLTPEPSELAPEEGISPYVFEQARKLEYCLSHLRVCNLLHEEVTARGQTAIISWDEQRSPSGRDHIAVTPELVFNLKETASVLYANLKDAGEEVLAQDLVEQHREQQERLREFAKLQTMQPGASYPRDPQSHVGATELPHILQTDNTQNATVFYEEPIVRKERKSRGKGRQDR